MPGKAKAHAQRHAVKYAGLAGLLMTASGVSQLERIKAVACGDQQAAMYAVASGYVAAISTATDRATRAEDALERCANKLSTRCRR